MSICFVNFYKSRNDHHGATQSLGAMRLAAMALKAVPDLEIELLSYSIDENNKDIARDILSHQPSCIGFSVQDWSTNMAESVCNQVIQLGYKHFLLVGGSQAVFLDKNHWLPDTLFVTGEGENFIYDFFKNAYFDKSKLSNIRTSQPISTNIPCGIPLFSDQFLKAVGGIKKIDLRVLLWETSRGCQYRCGFCGHNFRKEITLFPWEIVEYEIHEILKLRPRNLFIVDPSMGGTPPRLEKILNIFQRYESNINITGYIRPEYVGPNIVRALSSSQISELMIGIQTLNPAVPKWIRKNNYPTISENLPLLSKSSIPWRAELIIGLPGDTLTGFKNSIRDVIELYQPRWLRTYHLLVIPGTSLDSIKNHENSKLWVHTDIGNRAQESSSYSADELVTMRLFGGAISSLYSFLRDAGQPSYSFESLERIVKDKVISSPLENHERFIVQDKHGMDTFWENNL